jgi:hypothetical protein
MSTPVSRLRVANLCWDGDAFARVGCYGCAVSYLQGSVEHGYRLE